MAKRRAKDRHRGKRREGRHERRQQQQSGGGEWDCITIPAGLETFKAEKGETYHIDIIPYIVGNNNKNADPGDEYFELLYPVYNDLGIDEKRFIAIGELLGVRDPVAEHFATLRKGGAEWDDMKAFKPKWRQLMLFFVHEEPDKGLQFFEGAYATFGEQLDEELLETEEKYKENFDDPDAGATLEVRFKAKNIGTSNPWILAAKINFIERASGFDADGDEKLAAEILEQAGAICLDDCLKVPSYDNLQKALDGEPVVDGKPEEDKEPEGDAADTEEKPKAEAKGQAKRKQPTAADLGIAKGGEVEHDEHGVCTVLRVAKDGLTVTIVDAADEIHKGIDPTDLEPLGNGEPKDPPAEKSAARSAKNKSTTTKKGGAKDAEKKSHSEDKGKGDEDWDQDWED